MRNSNRFVIFCDSNSNRTVILSSFFFKSFIYPGKYNRSLVTCFHCNPVILVIVIVIGPSYYLSNSKVMSNSLTTLLHAQGEKLNKKTGQYC